jgi:hypothetical protein
MQDDDLADATDQLLQTFDEFLSNGKLVAQLSPTDLSSMRTIHDNVEAMLEDYRRVSGFTDKRPTRARVVPIGPKQGMAIPVLLGAAGALTIPAEVGIGAGASTGAGVGLALGEILLPLTIVAIAAVTLPGAHAALIAVAAEDLRYGLRALARKILELDALNQALAMTAAAAAKLTTDELVKILTKVLGNFAASLSIATVILAELATRFPQCAAQIGKLQDLVKQLARTKTGGAQLGSGWYAKLNKLVGDINSSLPDMLRCIASGAK